MLNKKAVEKILSDVMDTIPELEGIIAASAAGKVVAGQTLRGMDHSAIVESITGLLRDSKTVNKAVEQGATQVLYIETEKGYTVAVDASKCVAVAIAGKDAAPSLGLIIRNLRAAAEKIGAG
jgi:predicted regulator of Ras-like GTPase activity (Roadblock/LC7/MglB family)